MTDTIESLIADLIQATNDIHLAHERQAEAIEALRDAWQDLSGDGATQIDRVAPALSEAAE